MSYNKRIPDITYKGVSNIDIIEIETDDGVVIETTIKTKVKIKKIHDKKIEWTRIGSVQMKYDVTEEFQIRLCSNEEQIIESIEKIVELAQDNEIDILCFPEFIVSFNNFNKTKHILEKISKISKNMIIILGTYYLNDENICPIIIDGIIYKEVKKSIPSRFESKPIGDMKSGDTIYVYKTTYGDFCIFICRDIEILPKRILDTIFLHNKEIHLIITPEYNPQSKNYQKIASDLVNENECYLILSNRSKKDNHYGGSSIFGKIHDDVHRSLINKGYKSNQSPPFLIIETNTDEQIIWVDVCLSYRAPILGTTTRRPNSIIGDLGRIEIK